MKDIKEILNLPVVSIQDGEEIAIIKSVMINCESKSVEYLIIEKKDNRQIFLEAIPYSEIIGFGCYAVTVDSSLSVMSFDLLKLDEKQFKKHDDIVAQKIITQLGDYVGVVLGFDFDENSGDINSITYKDNTTQNKKVDRANLLTIGYKLLVIKSQEKDYIVKRNRNNSKNYDNQGYEKKSDYQELDNVLDEEISLAIGKTISTDLYDYEGNMLLKSGTVISEKDIENIRKIDENLVYELLSSV